MKILLFVSQKLLTCWSSESWMNTETQENETILNSYGETTAAFNETSAEYLNFLRYGFKLSKSDFENLMCFEGISNQSLKLVFNTF